MDLSNREDRLIIIKKALRHLLCNGDLAAHPCEGALCSALCKDLFDSDERATLIGFMDQSNQGRLFNEYENAILDMLSYIEKYRPKYRP